MIFQCDACQHTYEFGNNSIRCLFCGKDRARPATAEEIRALRTAKTLTQPDTDRQTKHR